MRSRPHHDLPGSRNISGAYRLQESGGPNSSGSVCLQTLRSEQVDIEKLKEKLAKYEAAGAKRVAAHASVCFAFAVTLCAGSTASAVSLRRDLVSLLHGVHSRRKGSKL